MEATITPIWYMNTSWDTTTFKINVNYIIK
jgi:hypothetical protein